MKLYTKTGDKGSTSLFGGKRVSKHHARLHAYGAIDELNAQLGLAASILSQSASQELQDVREALLRVQQYLFVIGSHLATPYNPSDGAPKSLPTLSETETQWLETQTDMYSASVPELRQFILPGGHQAAATLHVARTVCRRAERHIVELADDEDIDEHSVRYINRLSDMLFAMARYVNHASNTSDVLVSSL